MSRVASLAGPACLIGLAIATGLCVTGCSSDRSYRLRPDRTNVVQRPVYDTDGTKNLYLGGYAGANYDFGARAAQ